MNDEILERISQNIYGEEFGSDGRNAEVANWLYRSCTPGTPEHDRAKLLKTSHGLFGQESIVAEEYAISHNLWFADDSLLGMVGPAGDENNCYLSPDGLTIFKINMLTHSGGRILPVFEKVLIHNAIFPSTRYDFVGFTNLNFARTAYPIFKQKMVTNAHNATPTEIAEHMTALGFSEDKDSPKPSAWRCDKYLIWDLQPKNVLKKDDRIFIIDAEITLL